MKPFTLLVCFAIALFLSGCGTVVYQIRPEAPPTMSHQEAMEAMELSLSMLRFIRDTYKVEANAKGFTFHTFRSYSRTVDYEHVERYVHKMGEDYVVFFTTRSFSEVYRGTLSWKSQEDARLFVDAAHALSKGSRRTARTSEGPKQAFPPRQIAKKEETAPPAKAPPLAAQAPSTSSQPSPVAQAPVQPPKPAIVQGAMKQIEQPEKPAAAPTVVASPKQPPKPPVKILVAKPKAPRKEEPPPQITITSPDTTRAVQIAAKQHRTLITGNVQSRNDLSVVTINGEPAELDDKGNFSLEVSLKIGENKIQVAAQDIKGQSSTKEFSIHREIGKVMQARKEIPVPTSFIGTSTFHALLIAVQDYDSRDITRLDNPIPDARRLKEVLTTQYTFDPSNVIILENPDRRTIYKNLQAMRKQLTERDSLFIFYAGHGMWVDDMKQGFWLPRDSSGANDPSDWISNSNIRDYIKAFHAQHVLLVADACFSGGIFKVREAFSKSPLAIEKIFEMNSRKAITSGSLKSVPDRSVFVEYLVKRLRDNRDPYLDSQKLFTSLREAVINNSPTSQTPLYGAISEAGDEGGDFVFVRRQAE